MLLGAVLGRALVAIAQTFSIVSTTDAAGEYKYAGAAAVGTTVYFAPYRQTHVGMLDLDTNSFSTIDVSEYFVTGADKYYFDALAVGTTVYFAPYFEDNVGVLDTTTTTTSFSTIDTTVAGVTADYKYAGAALVGTIVYFPPEDVDNVGVLDTVTSSFSTIDTTVAGVTGTYKYFGAAAVGTSVFFSPYFQDNVGVLDTVTSSFSTIDITAAGVTEDYKYAGAAAVGTTVIFAPGHQDNVGVLDTTTSSFSTIDTTAAGVTGEHKYRGAVAVGTSVYFPPHNQDNVGVLDTTTSKFSTIDVTSAGVTGGEKYYGAAVVRNYTVVFGPQLADTVGVLTLGGRWSSAGDDPTFVGADGLPYEVRGEPWKYFNLLSTPALSLNAQFLPVPERFVHGKITDTVLGTLHLALCDAPRSRIVGATFDVFSGEIGCTVRSPDETPGSSEQAPCDEVLPLAGATVTTEPGMCNLATMECGFVPPELNLTDFMETNPALVGVHMRRYNLSVAGTNLSLVRDVVDRPEPDEELDCSVLSTAWKRALRACETLRDVLRGASPLAAWLALPEQDRVATLARATSGNRTRQLHFYNALVEALPYVQGDVHGLLGQRSVSPTPMRGPAAWGPNPLGALALSTAQLQTNNDGAAAGGGGSAGTLQVAIDADGHHQGEGAIEGSYRDYQVRYVSSHGPGTHKHSRFVCGAAAGSAATVEA